MNELEREAVVDAAPEPQTLAELLASRGWIHEGSGVYSRPRETTSGHEHSATCTAESCGPSARFRCTAGEYCIRIFRKSGGQERTPCAGHPVPRRERLVEHALERKGMTEAAAAGTPLGDDDAKNTWSNER